MQIEQSPDNIIFEEQQRFNQWWLRLLLIGIATSAVYGIYEQLIIGEPFGSKPMSDDGVMAYFVFSMALILLFRWMRLDTRIDQNGIYMRFTPFVTKSITWSEVQNLHIVHYGFVGGWGIRFFTAYGTVYNMRGTKGLAINLEKGKKFLIGTQKPDLLNQFIQTHFSEKIHTTL